MTKNPLQLPVSKVFEHNYQVPIYQRNYAWTEVEIIQLIEDIDKQEKDGSEPLYYLNMVGFEVSDKIFNRQDNE